MKTKLVNAFVVLALFIFLTATTLAQPVPSGPDYLNPNYPSDPYYPGPDYPSDPNYPGPGYPSDPNYPSGPTDPYYPGPQPSPATTPATGNNDGGHPSAGPISSQPLSAPSGSSTEALNYEEGQALSQQEVFSSGMMASGSGTASNSRSVSLMMVSGLQIWTRYNGMWTTDPASVFFWRSTSILSNNDQAQTVWSWERYPNGQQSWRNWGYRMPGYFHGRFFGDARGWHQLAMWGSRSGWSNVVWIYVW
ncbi:MAG: hypothetical protein JW999_10100 [Methanotrichaceae archaeon]|nr:hypothetical protein [Methanotrichaceae archaeon]